MRLLINRGFLSDYIFPPIDTIINTEGIKTSAGDYNLKQLEAASSTEKVVSECVAKWLAYGSTRNCSMFFCVSRAHGRLVEKEIAKYIGNHNVCYVDGETKNRGEILKDIVAGKYKAVVSIAALTTGFDAPIVDCVVLLRATKSASLFVQICGRGLRIYPGKANCLVLDMAGNFERFGSIENPLSKARPIPNEKKNLDGTEEGEEPKDIPLKDCPNCALSVPIGVKVCEYCQHIFINHGTSEWRQGNEGDWIKVLRTNVQVSKTKKGETAVVFEYLTPLGAFKEYFLTERKNQPWHKWKCDKRKNQYAKGIEKIKGEINGRLINISDVSVNKKT
jgi:DNA repair protein RadD